MDILGQLAASLISGHHLSPEDLREDAVPERIGRYEVVRPLGRGGGGRVFLAEDPALGRVVAVKLLGRAGRAAEERFTREMQLLARLEHPGIVRVLDAGTSEEGDPFFVMEHVDAPALGDRRLPLPVAVRMLEAVARACHAAHQAGVVHRDLKPANVLVGERPVVLDFGVACLQGEDEAGTRVGTPEYMAPEQASGRGPIGPWTDVWALGVLLYEQLTGRTPFEDEDPARVLARLQSEAPRPPRDAPPALERLALAALSRDHRARPPSALAFAEALRAWREGPARRRRALLVAAGVLVFLGSAFAVGVLTRPAPETPAPPAPTPTPPPAREEAWDAPQPRRPGRGPPPPGQQGPGWGPPPGGQGPGWGGPPPPPPPPGGPRPRRGPGEAPWPPPPPPPPPRGHGEPPPPPPPPQPPEPPTPPEEEPPE